MNNVNVKGELNKTLRLPFLLLPILVVANLILYGTAKQAAIIMTVGLVVYAVLLFIFSYRREVMLPREMVTFATQYGQVQKQLMLDYSLPYAITDTEGYLLWNNKAFAELTGREHSRFQKSIEALFPNLRSEHFPEAGEEVTLEATFGDRAFEVLIRNVVLDELIDNSEILEREGDAPVSMLALLFNDVTELRRYRQMAEDERPVCGLIYLDNYEEALESVEDVRRSLLSALIDRKINAYFHELDGLVQKFEKDKYQVIMRTRTLEELKEKRFDILEDVKTVNIGNEMAVTLSVGIGAGGDSYSRNAESARIAIELALGRGGDQVVLRDGESISYFGGKTQAVEKNTRVKARVKAHALKEFIESKEKVVVMGHKLLDIDGFGASVGIFRVAETLGKKAHIVVDTPNTGTRPFLETFRNPDIYDKDLMISVKEAKEMVDEDTLLVVVDTNRPEYTECEELLSQTRTVVVLDHHRQSDDHIKDFVLSYIEPYASSACEMVAEILQYFPDTVKMRNNEADALYAGIMVDTDNFMQKAGVRTFEAAAFLRRSGADTTRIRKMFREDMADYRVKGEVLRNVEMYRERFAISVCPAEGLESPTVVASQAANQLLDIKNVKASFVLTEYNGTVYISARAIDEVNVQIIMERLGGGGHLNIAGCQFPGATIEDATQKLKQVLDEMMEGGELE